MWEVAMSILSEQWMRVWGFVKGRPAEVIRSVAIPPECIVESGASPSHFVPGKNYFAVVINEMFLAEGRQWFTIYDPMALVVTEFTYDGKRAIVPFVAGPSLLEGKVQHIPNGIAITDTLVAGVHPYVGGKFALTIILAQVKRESYAKRLLTVVEKVSGAFALGAAVGPQLKVAGAVMDGVESLFGMSDTKAIIGHRWEYNDGTTPWLKPGFFALINADEPSVEETKLSVVRGRLRTGSGDTARGFRSADYLLYSLCSVDRRTDVRELAFYHLFEQALRDAASADKGGWDRSKAGLVTLYQEMLASPDLTWDQVQQLADTLKKQLVEAHEHTAAIQLLGGEGESAKAVATYDEVGVLGGPDSAVRLERLREIHELLGL
jgi:hypothetical protein